MRTRNDGVGKMPNTTQLNLALPNTFDRERCDENDAAGLLQRKPLVVRPGSHTCMAKSPWEGVAHV